MNTKTNIFIFSHQDDEIGLLNHIQDSKKKFIKTKIFYLTNGSINKTINKNRLQLRDKESIKALKKLGVKKREIIFLGRKLNVNVYQLINNLDIIYKSLKKFLKNIKGDIEIYTHANEGGNIDHDCCFYIVKKMMNELKNIKKSFQFHLYNSYKMPSILYNVMYPLKKNENKITTLINLKQKILYIKILFIYKSQILIWFGLYPFIIKKIIFNEYGKLQIIKKDMNIERPHKGLLWYEKRNFMNYEFFKKKIVNFFSK